MAWFGARYPSKLQQKTFSTPESVFWDILMRVIRFTGRKWLSLVSMLKAKLGKKTSTYLVSGTTIQHYIVPGLKEQLFFHKNLVLDLFCHVVWTSSVNKFFPRISSLTIYELSKVGKKWNWSCLSIKVTGSYRHGQKCCDEDQRHLKGVLCVPRSLVSPELFAVFLFHASWPFIAFLFSACYTSFVALHTKGTITSIFLLYAWHVLKE